MSGFRRGERFERVAELVRKELLQAFRDPRMTRIIFVAPVIQLMVFGYAVSTDIRDTTTFVVDHDHTQRSRDLLTAFTASGYFRIVGRSERSDDLLAALDRGRAIVGLEIPPGFARDTERGTGTFQILVDGTNSNTATIALGHAERIAQRHALTLRPLPRAPAVELRERAWFNPALLSRNYNVPAVVGVIVTLICLLLTALAIVREREVGTLEQLRVSPLTPGELLAGKTIPFALVGILDFAIVTAVAILWFRVPFEGSMALLLLSSLLYLLTALGIGLWISTISSTQQEAFMATFLFLMPAILLSGFMFPVRSMPEAFQLVTLANPLRHYLDVVRAVFLKGSTIADLARPLAWQLGSAVVVFLFARARFYRSLE
jgi:ABC-2 type transport system permease protein